MWLQNTFRFIAFVLAFSFACVLIFNMSEVQLVTTTTHIASTLLLHPYDHHYMTADSWINPIDRPGHEPVLVDNTCRLWRDDTWLFCGMLPWQHNPCRWTGVNASNHFFSYLATENYQLKKGDADATSLWSDFAKMQRLDLPPTQIMMSSKSRDVCQYENFHDLQMIRNEPDAFSIASTHSPVVLMWGVWLVLTVCYAMAGKKSFAKMFTTEGTEDKEKKEQMIVNAVEIVLFALIVFLFFYTRFAYGSGMVESGSVIVPNASFVYVLFALLWTMLWTRSDVADGNPEKKNVSGVQPFEQGLVTPAPQAVDIDGLAPMQIDVSNFAGTKLKTRAYLQGGDEGRYPKRVASLTEVDTDLTSSIKLLQPSDYEAVEFESTRFYIAQMWVVPFTMLSLFLFDSGFAMDIDVTLVAVMSFLFGIIDVFVAKLRNVSGIMENFAISDDTKQGMRYMLLLVQFVLLFIESCVLWVLVFFIEPRVEDTAMMSRRMNAIKVFCSFHVILNALMLVMQAFNQYHVKFFSSLLDKESNVSLKNRHFVQALRHLNLFLFCLLAWIYVVEVNDSGQHLKLNEYMYIFDGKDACNQEMNTASPMNAKCSLGLSFSNLYSQTSSIYFKAAQQVITQNGAYWTALLATATPAPTTRR